jgi:alpha-L-fucosidase
MLADIVSKNGNMLLNVVLYADGSLPPEPRQFLDEMTDWMAVNGEAIHDTRPWKIFGEGPTVTTAGSFKEDTSYTSEDIRFTQSKDGRTLYAIILGVPTEPVRIKTLATEKIANVALLGSDKRMDWKLEADTLVIQPVVPWPSKFAVAFKITLKQ